MNNYKIHARLSGTFFLTAFVGGITGLLFAQPALESPLDLTAIAKEETQVLLGVLGITLLAVSTSLIAVPMYPVLRKKNEGMALAAIVFRTIESAIYLIWIISTVALVKLSILFVEAGSPSNDPSYQTIGEVLQEIQGTHFGVVFFVIGAFMYYYLFYQTKLVPKWLAAWGIIGVILNFINVFFLLFAVYDPGSTIAIITEIPLATNELTLAIWLIVKGYDPKVLEALDN